jgi:predicted nucleotidyltransferase
MLKSRSEIEVVVACYLEALQEQNVDVERVYLYGSHLHGTANEWSDVDVIVVSPTFRGKTAWERAQITGTARYHTFCGTRESVEALAKTPEEVEECHAASFLAGILREAVVVFDRSLTSLWKESG